MLNVTDITPAGTVLESLQFTATGTTTTLFDEGYQLPGFNQFTDNSVTLTGGGLNLLGQIWGFTPAAFGSDTDQYDDGTSVNGLDFGGVSIGSYDVYFQTFATTPGQSYTYTFNFVQNEGEPDGYIVRTDSASGAPEPATWLLLIGGIVGSGLMLRREKLALSY